MHSDFINYCDFAARKTTEKPIGVVLDEFQALERKHGYDVKNGYSIKNQAYLISSLYILVVYPKEAYSQKKKNFEFRSRRFFNFKKGDSNINGDKFLQLIRHSISHANIEADFTTQLFSFRNYSKNKVCNFHVEISANELGVFIIDAKRYFSSIIGDEITFRACSEALDNVLK